MAKLLSVVIVFILLIPASGFAADKLKPTPAPAPVSNLSLGTRIGFDFSANIAANYIFWAQMLGIKNIKTDISYYTLTNSMLLFVDDLSIKYDSNTFQTLSVDLFFMDYKTFEQEISLRTARALCLFATIELGKPAFDSQSEIEDMVNLMWPIYESFTDCIAENFDAISAGSDVPFYFSNTGLVYSVSSDKDLGIIIHIK